MVDSRKNLDLKIAFSPIVQEVSVALFVFQDLPNLVTTSMSFMCDYRHQIEIK
jgi:hypothetical protein